VLNSVAVGLRRMVPSNVANVFTNSLNFVFSLGALLIHPSLVTYGAANAASYLVGVGAAYVGARHIWGSLPLAWPSRSRAGTILSFGVKTQLHAFADLVNVQADKIVLAFLVGVRAAASYEIAARVVMAVRAVGMLTISAMIPTVAAHIAEHGREALPRLYRRYTRLTVGLSFPVFVLACVTAPFLMKAWLDQVPPRAPGTVVVISLAYLAPLSCIVAMNIATADGRPGFVASNSLLIAALNVALTIALAPVLGFWGVLAGTVVALAVGSVILVVRFHRSYGIALDEYARAVAPPAALALGLGAAFATVVALTGWTAPSRGASALIAAAIALAYAALYWPLASALHFLPRTLALRSPLRRVTAPEP
jgi:O-antigen/teichoic acid export membrane protein